MNEKERKVIEELRKELDIVLSIDPNAVPIEQRARPNAVSTIREICYPGHVILEKKLQPQFIREAMLTHLRDYFRSVKCDWETFEYRFTTNRQTLDVMCVGISQLGDDSPLHGTMQVIGPKTVNKLLERAVKESGTGKEGTA